MIKFTSKLENNENTSGLWLLSLLKGKGLVWPGGLCSWANPRWSFKAGHYPKWAGSSVRRQCPVAAGKRHCWLRVLCGRCFSTCHQEEVVCKHHGRRDLCHRCFAADKHGHVALLALTKFILIFQIRKSKFYKKLTVLSTVTNVSPCVSPELIALRSGPEWVRRPLSDEEWEIAPWKQEVKCAPGAV